MKRTGRTGILAAGLLLGGALNLVAAGAAIAQYEFAPAPTDSALAASDGKAPAPSERGLRILAGPGLSLAPSGHNDNDEPYGLGVYLEAAKLWRRNTGAQPQLYAGLVATGTRASSCPPGDFPCDISATTVQAGGKVRIMVPIPYLGPFLELGAGFSAGRIVSERGYPDDDRASGLLFHIPFAIGVAVGPEHRTTVAFTYLVYPGKAHVDGAFAIGYDLPLD